MPRRTCAPRIEESSQTGLDAREAVVMENKDERNVLDALKAELSFVEKGGYGRSVREPWKPTSVFQDSLSCLCYPNRQHDDCCFLVQFVAPEDRTRSVPCHHIRLNAKGDTVADLEERNDQQALEQAVSDWLKQAIAELEAQDEQVCKLEGLAHQ
jgi:hypothetical protein